MAHSSRKYRQPEGTRRNDEIPAPRTWVSQTNCSDSMSELDIWFSADILLNRFGGAAAIIVSKRADALLGRGDLKGASEWGRIAMAIANLERKRFGNGGMLH